MSSAAPGQDGARPALALRHLSKTFGGVRALDDVSLTILPGEVHGLLGENGSGKSTLIKVLAGFHAPESGELEVYGESVSLPLRPGAFKALGLDFVHQDLGLVPSLTVVENLRVAELGSSMRRYHVSWRRERQRARATFARYGVELDPRATVSDLRPVERALLAIVRGVEGMRARLGAGDGGGAARGILVLDEPTVFLPRAGTDQLFSLIRDIVSTGASVLFVSHDLDEVREITDRVTVLRDGRVVGTVETALTDGPRLVGMIIGRQLGVLEAQHRDLTRKRVAASVEDVVGGLLRGVSLDVHEGEVVGLTGLVGSGFEEMPYLLFGARPAERGRIVLGGRSHDLTGMTPSRALRARIALIPADRQRDASILSLPVTDNITLQTLDSYFRTGVLRRGEMVREAGSLMRRFDVRPPNPRLTYSSLSGGNQQKALLAKWLGTGPALLLLHEPTQGVDVGAREQIFSLIGEAAAEGMSIICASADYEQLAVICDRVLVLGRGRVVSELTGAEITKERITEQCYHSVTMPELSLGGT